MTRKEIPMRHTILAAAVTLMAAPLAAQTSSQVTNDLTVTITPQQYRICNDRPARPTWMDEVHPREAYKALTLMRLMALPSAICAATSPAVMKLVVPPAAKPKVAPGPALPATAPRLVCPAWRRNSTPMYSR